MSKLLGFAYGVVCYLVFFVTFLYAIGFVTNLVVPKSIDSGAEGPLGTALLINLAVLSVFAIQHSVMARQGFKKWWTQFVPKSVERNTYVLLASLALILVYWQWRPISGTVWHVENQTLATLLLGVGLAGWLVVLAATMMIDHFSLFGLSQAIALLTEKMPAETSFRTPGLYRYVRHPIYFGFIVAFWATPRMTAGHLLFAAVTTAYIFVGISLEERDLRRMHGASYEHYRKAVSMIVPLPSKPGELAQAHAKAKAAGQA